MPLFRKIKSQLLKNIKKDIGLYINFLHKYLSDKAEENNIYIFTNDDLKNLFSYFRKRIAKLQEKKKKARPKLEIEKVSRLEIYRLKLISYFSLKQTKPYQRKWHLYFKRRLSEIGQSVLSAVTLKSRFIVFSIAFTLLLATISLGIYDYVFKDLPSPTLLSQQEQNLTTKIYDRNGQILYRIYKDENRTLIPLSQLKSHTIEALIAIEDKDFFEHNGFDLRGIGRAMLINLKGEEIHGGSTLTQQLVKNRLLTFEKKIRRKLRELVLSILVEGTYTKNEILEMYLNEVSFGGSVYGIEEASWRYFNKSAKDLTLAESALLAALPAAPSIYSPYGPNPEKGLARKNKVLDRMQEEGFITTLEARQAKKEKLDFNNAQIDIKAPHFVMYLKKILTQMYSQKKVEQGGLKVKTTLDLGLQREVQGIIQEELEKIENLNVQNGAALVINPQDGEILAMVGSKNYFDFANDGQVNVTTRPRQPGSSIKPLTYALAFEKGFQPTSIIDDSKVTYKTAGSPPYSPKNYDNKFHGKVSLRQALACSYNIPAVKLLASIQLDYYLDRAEELGISTWQDRNRFGLALTLGGGEVLMTDLAKIYATFANQGYKIDYNPIIEIRDEHDNLIYQNQCLVNYYSGKKCDFIRTLDPGIAYMVTHILKDNQARTPAFGSQSVLHIPDQEVAVKTGTTNNMRDNWTLGYIQDRLAAVWVGNNDNQPMRAIASGVTGASPIWNRVIRLVLDDDEPHVFPVPSEVVKIPVCGQGENLVCGDSCQNGREEVFLAGNQPDKNCQVSNDHDDKESQITKSVDGVIE